MSPKSMSDTKQVFAALRLGMPDFQTKIEDMVSEGDKIAIATMYGFSNDWFFATTGKDINATQKGDVSSSIGLFDRLPPIASSIEQTTSSFSTSAIPPFIFFSS